ncbi:DUF4097 family beta strand repeat-containing protein [Halalkalicoccus jeotgali]|uniref:DUF4097 domain-containing protein n=1 Tax=Halalkalicoccus jeotgali (strain DSM 18796 / CECT 7217 / JCM 14584 / KCTC 4019 / B3) TaxID=795797 RepID=D8J9F4_HALJB|nr:DUF4097 family beta strand repeat-containing protein [Halalkalicoccus jeotgali]ADJ14366.1 hypothetical protein HacjB3_04875 [Halalkalicoccus jeotgali B3]ELY40627.1 hypothetical protein C497_03252 [Halalkalicoccus jeotgali B3]
MERTSGRRAVLGSCGLAVSAFLSGCTGELTLGGDREELNRTFEAPNALAVETDSGAVTVHPTGADRIELHAIKRSKSPISDTDGTRVETVRDADRLRIVAETGGGAWFGSAGTISLDVGVPAKTRLEHAAAQNGPATVTDVAGDARIESTNGAVIARRIDGAVSLSSTNGAIRAHEIAALDRAETTNGSIDLAVPAVRRDASITTTNGPITAALAPDLDADVIATTTNGSTATDGLALSGTDDSATGTLGDGTYELLVESTNGTITLEALG